MKQVATRQQQDVKKNNVYSVVSGELVTENSGRTTNSRHWFPVVALIVVAFNMMLLIVIIAKGDTQSTAYQLLHKFF